MLEIIPKVENMSEEEARKRLKELNKEIRKHEIIFILFSFIGLLELILTIIGLFNLTILTIIIILGSVFICYKIFKYSEPYEIEKYFIELIFGKNKK